LDADEHKLRTQIKNKGQERAQPCRCEQSDKVILFAADPGRG